MRVFDGYGLFDAEKTTEMAEMMELGLKSLREIWIVLAILTLLKHLSDFYSLHMCLFNRLVRL